MCSSSTALRPVRTSTPPDTIWSRILEDEFRRHLVTLEERTNAVPINVVHEPVNTVNDGNHGEKCLPLNVEKQVADDIAFVAAVTEGAQSVAGVCLEQHIDQYGMTLIVRVAGMDVVDDSVKGMLGNIAKLLQVASRTDTNETVDLRVLFHQVFELITLHHRQKLHGRLRSKKWQKPKHLSLTHKKPLWRDFQNVIHRVQHVYPKRIEKKVRSDTEQELSTLQRIYEDFDSIAENDHHEHLQALIKATYSFCRQSNICEFAAKLENAGTTLQIAAALRTLHQLEKIGSYWRIPLSLIEAAQKYPHVFGQIKLEYLVPYTSVPTAIAYESWARTCHVHAEIQLAVDYGIRRQRATSEPRSTGTEIIWPKTIGTSKYLCYLCYLFLTYQGAFLVLNTHGRLYDQWTVPDLAEYDEGTRSEFAHVLEQVDRHICKQIEEIKEPIWRAEPMTSRQNLLHLDDRVEGMDRVASEAENSSV